MEKELARIYGETSLAPSGWTKFLNGVRKNLPRTEEIID